MNRLGVKIFIVAVFLGEDGSRCLWSSDENTFVSYYYLITE